MQNTIKLSSQAQVAHTSLEERLQAAYQAFRHRLTLATADKFFFNAAQYLQALTQEAEGSLVLHMRRGLNFTVRRNIWDTESIREVFVERSFLKQLRLGKTPTVVEIGGYIGSFSIYAIKAFQAAQVVTYESSSENFKLLSQNVVNNSLDHRITPVNDKVDNLETLLNRHQLQQVDLLRADASRDGLAWLLATPQHLLCQIKHIILSLPSEGSLAIAPALAHLEAAGYSVRQEKGMIYARR